MPPEPPAEKDFTPPISPRGKIYALLIEGFSLTASAKMAKCSVKTASKWASFYVDKGLLERTIRYPAQFQKKASIKEILPPPIASAANGVKSPLLRPHRVGAILAIAGRPNVIRKQVWHTVKEWEYTLQIGIDKAIFWLNFTTGDTPDENLIYAKVRTNELCALFTKKYSDAKHQCSFAPLRYLQGIEWTLTDKPASKTMAQEVPIKKGDRQEIADALFWFDSISHPKEVQITPAPGKPLGVPTDHARTLYYLLVHAPSLMQQITESIVVVNQKAETLAQEIEKLKKVQP